MKEKILEELKKAKNHLEVIRIAEELVYKLEPVLELCHYVVKFDGLRRKDLEKLGYEVFELGIEEYEDKERFAKKLKDKGYLYIHDCYFNKKTKIAFALDSYPVKLYIPINKPQNQEKLSELASLDDFRNLIADKIIEALEEFKMIAEKENFKDWLKNI